MAETTKKNLSTGKIISIGLIAALAATVIFLVIQNLGLKGDVEESLENAESLEAEIESVEKQLNEYEILLDSKDLEVERKQQMLDERDSLLQAKDAKISSLLAKNRISQEEAERLRGKVESLEFFVKKFQGEIDLLKQQIAHKDATIDSLNQTLGGTRDSLRGTIDDNIRKSITLKAGAKLSVFEFTFARYKQSGTTEVETAFRASQLDRLKICVNISENRVADAGEKVAYFQVRDAAGKLVMDESKSGFFKVDGQNQRYSCMAPFTFTKDAVKVCADFYQPAGFKYAEGKYTVQAFCEGWEIGNADFTVD